MKPSRGFGSKTQRHASQSIDNNRQLLCLDLHGCSVADAERIVPLKCDESAHAGLRGVFVIYGKSGNDLSTAVHKAVRAHSLVSKTISCSFSWEQYSETANGDSEDVALIVLFENRDFQPKARFIAPFTTAYGGEAAGFATDDDSKHRRLGFDFELAHKVSEHFSFVVPKKTVPKKTTGGQGPKTRILGEKVKYPDSWLRSKR